MPLSFCGRGRPVPALTPSEPHGFAVAGPRASAPVPARCSPCNSFEELLHHEGLFVVIRGVFDGIVDAFDG